MGFAAIYVSEEHGGVGLGRLEASLVFEALATGCVGSSAYLSIHNMCSWMIDTYGTEEQKKTYLPDMCTMERLSSYCLTEPNSGSDAASMKTTAVDKGDHWLMNGSKMFISGAGASGVYIVMALSGENEISCFIVDGDSKGIEYGANEDKMGWNVQPTKLISFDNVKVPKNNLLGGKGNGFKIAMSGLDGGRINIASCSLGGAAFCLETAKEYIKVRKQFGKPLSDNQYLQFKLAEMATDLETSRLMVRHAARMVNDKTPNYTMYAAMAKKFATERCMSVVNYSL